MTCLEKNNLSHINVDSYFLYTAISTAIFGGKKKQDIETSVGQIGDWVWGQGDKLRVLWVVKFNCIHCITEKL